MFCACMWREVDIKRVPIWELDAILKAVAVNLELGLEDGSNT